MTKETERNYTEAQEARISTFAAEQDTGRINKDSAAVLANEFGKNVKSVIAKAVRMGVYQRQERKSVNGGDIVRKDELVAEIAALVGANLEGLEKAPKVALERVRDALKAA